MQNDSIELGKLGPHWAKTYESVSKQMGAQAEECRAAHRKVLMMRYEISMLAAKLLKTTEYLEKTRSDLEELQNFQKQLNME